jgi:hypothetical protein
MNPETLATMEKILQLNLVACAESALHGLGHWQRFCPDEVAAIINRHSCLAKFSNYALGWAFS